MRTAAARHDEGWRRRDARLLFDADARRPLHFLESPPASTSGSTATASHRVAPPTPTRACWSACTGPASTAAAGPRPARAAARLGADRPGRCRTAPCAPSSAAGSRPRELAWTEDEPRAARSRPGSGTTTSCCSCGTCCRFYLSRTPPRAVAGRRRLVPWGPQLAALDHEPPPVVLLPRCAATRPAPTRRSHRRCRAPGRAAGSTRSVRRGPDHGRRGARAAARPRRGPRRGCARLGRPRAAPTTTTWRARARERLADPPPAACSPRARFVLAEAGFAQVTTIDQRGFPVGRTMTAFLADRTGRSPGAAAPPPPARPGGDATRTPWSPGSARRHRRRHQRAPARLRPRPAAAADGRCPRHGASRMPTDWTVAVYRRERGPAARRRQHQGAIARPRAGRGRAGRACGRPDGGCGWRGSATGARVPAYWTTYRGREPRSAMTVKTILGYEIAEGVSPEEYERWLFEVHAPDLLANPHLDRIVFNKVLRPVRQASGGTAACRRATRSTGSPRCTTPTRRPTRNYLRLVRGEPDPGGARAGRPHRLQVLPGHREHRGDPRMTLRRCWPRCAAAAEPDADLAAWAARVGTPDGDFPLLGAGTRAETYVALLWNGERLCPGRARPRKRADPGRSRGRRGARAVGRGALRGRRRRSRGAVHAAADR